MKRLIAPTAAAIVLGGGILAAPAAHAASTATVTVKLTLPKKDKVGEYGSDIPFNAPAATSSTGYSPSAGSYSLEKKAAGKSGWSKVGHGADQPYEATIGVKYKGNAQYKMCYIGGTDSEAGVTYESSCSAPVSEKTLYHVKLNQPKGTTVTGKISPAYKNKTVIITQGTTKKIGVARTNSKSIFKFKFHPKKSSTIKYFFHIKGSQAITATRYGAKIEWFVY